MLTTRLNLAALVLLAAVHYGERQASYEPGDEPELSKVLTPKGARDLVALQVVGPAVLDDPDAHPARPGFDACDHDTLEMLALMHDLTPRPFENGTSVTRRDLVDALLVAGVSAPTAEAEPAPPTDTVEDDAAPLA